MIRNVTVSYSLFLNRLIFQENKIYNFKTHLFSFLNTKLTNDGEWNTKHFLKKNVCGPFTKNKERIQKCRETGGSRCIYQNELDKACFQYGYFKDLARRRTSHKILHDKAFNIAKNPIYDGHQSGHASMLYKCFDKKTSGNW